MMMIMMIIVIIIIIMAEFSPPYSWDYFQIYLSFSVKWGHPVVQLVETLRYKSEGRGLHSRLCHWNFSLT